MLNGSRLDGAAAAGATNRLYKNNRDGTFTDVTEKAGLMRTGWASGVTIGDYNNDGFEDIFITYYGQNVLYRNNGDGTFTDVTKAPACCTRNTRWGSGCTFIDYDKDGHLDLFVGNYRRFRYRKVGKPGANRGCTDKTYPFFAARADSPAAPVHVPQQWRRHFHAMPPRLPASLEGREQFRHDRCRGRFR